MPPHPLALSGPVSIGARKKATHFSPNLPNDLFASVPYLCRLTVCHLERQRKLWLRAATNGVRARCLRPGTEHHSTGDEQSSRSRPVRTAALQPAAVRTEQWNDQQLPGKQPTADRPAVSVSSASISRMYLHHKTVPHSCHRRHLLQILLS